MSSSLTLRIWKNFPMSKHDHIPEGYVGELLDGYLNFQYLVITKCGLFFEFSHEKEALEVIHVALERLEDDNFFQWKLEEIRMRELWTEKEREDWERRKPNE